MPDLLRWLADAWPLLVAAAVVIGALWQCWRTLRPTACKVLDFLDDWRGEPGRPGVEARLGVMERLAAHDAALAELRPNGGSSIKDMVGRIDQRLEAVERVVVPDQPRGKKRSRPT